MKDKVKALFEDSRVVNVLAYLSGELLFVLLPIVVFAFVCLPNGLWGTLLRSSEWSFASMVLFGQTIIKVALLLSGEEPRHTPRFSFILTTLIIVGLVPSTVILALLLADEQEHIHDINHHPALLLVIAQFLWFLASTVVFFLIGGMAQSRSKGH